MLSATEIETYYKEGLVIPDFQLPEATVHAMRRSLDRLIEENPALLTDNLVCPHIRRGGAQALVGSQDWLDYACIPELLDMVADLIGSDFALWGSTLFGKPAGSGKTTPWHQDGEYWPIEPLATCSLWIAIDPATSDNGCLRYIPGSHRSKTLFKHQQNNSDALTLNMELTRDAFDETSAKDVVLAPGQVSLHDVHLIHGSEANRSAQRRAGYVCRYMPTSSLFNRERGRELERRNGAVDYATRPLWLMRGRDLCGQNDFSCGQEGA